MSYTKVKRGESILYMKSEMDLECISYNSIPQISSYILQGNRLYKTTVDGILIDALMNFYQNDIITDPYGFYHPNGKLLGKIDFNELSLHEEGVTLETIMDVYLGIYHVDGLYDISPYKI